jgi:hypothetical protein
MINIETKYSLDKNSYLARVHLMVIIKDMPI